MAEKKHQCITCERRFATREALEQHKRDVGHMTNEEAFEKVWDASCEVCGMSPVVRATGLCGPCTWGESDTIGGNW